MSVNDDMLNSAETLLLFFIPIISNLKCNLPNVYSLGAVAIIALISRPRDCPFRAYLLKHYQFWNRPENIGSIDELVGAARNVDRSGYLREVLPADWAVMGPTQLLNFLRRAHAERYGKEETYDFLESLPDHGRLQVLRSNHAIFRTARKLRNCAARY